MSQVSIRAALDTKLDAVSTNFPTAEENVKFYPKVGVPYQESFLIPARPANPTLGGSHHREEGIYQVNLHYPIQRGTGDVTTRAELIKAAFSRGTTMTNSGVNVVVMGTPEIKKGFPGDRGWWIVPILIRWYAEIFN